LRILIAYASYSGNTKEVAEHIEHHLQKERIDADMHHIDVDPFPEDVRSYDMIFLGTFTWDYGATPDEVKDFVYNVGYKPERVAVFGTGDTQFGEEYQYCIAVDKLAKFYNSPWKGLKIEQSPRGMQEQYIEQWLRGVLSDVYVYA